MDKDEFYMSYKSFTARKLESINTAIFLNALVKVKDDTDEEGWFSLDSRTVSDATALTYYQQRLAIQKLINLGLIEYTLKGYPIRRHFILNEEVLQNYI